MKKHILLCGNSIFMAGLADSLAERFEVTRAASGTRPLKSPARPDLILVDLCDPASAAALSDLCASGLPVIGLNPAESRATVLSGQAHAIHSLDELLALCKASA